MKEKFVELIINEKERIRLQYYTIFILLAVISGFMTCMNIVTHKGALTWVTGVFSLLCGMELLLLFLSRDAVRNARKADTAERDTGSREDACLSIVSALFMLEIVLMFLYFIISGNPEGFSVLWSIMLPACGMLIFGKRRATFLSALMFIILVFFFWTPVGQTFLGYKYNATFMMRFPVLFAAFFFVSYFLEVIRETTQKQMNLLRCNYEYLSSHDHLTSLLNRQGLMELHKKAIAANEQAVFMIDIDHFKYVNDTYGHDVGDIVLAKVAMEITEIAGAQVCRWGGEEFVVWFPDTKKMCDPEKIRRAVEEMDVMIPRCDKRINVTISIGVAKGAGDLQQLIVKADRALYKAKDRGRNRVESW